MSDPSEPPSNIDLLKIALISEGMLLALAAGLAWLIGKPLAEQVRWNTNAAFLGCVATVPMLLLLAVCYLSRSNGLQQIREFVRNLLGPLLHEGGWPVMVVLALLAGVCEEAFFRGFLYPWLQSFNPFLAMLLTNIAFALMHAVTPLYAWIAGMTGLYLTATLTLGSEPNLLIPMIAHSLYDLIAFAVVRHDYRSHTRDLQNEE